MVARRVGFAFYWLEPLYQKLNLLASSLAPTYVGNSFMRGNMVAITIGDYLRDQPGFISNITFDWEVDFIWHSGHLITIDLNPSIVRNQNLCQLASLKQESTVSYSMML